MIPNRKRLFALFTKNKLFTLHALYMHFKQKVLSSLKVHIALKLQFILGKHSTLKCTLQKNLRQSGTFN